MKSVRVSIAAFVLSTLPIASVLADTTPQALPFAQDWSNTGLITTNDNWAGVPGVEGFLGQDITTSTGTDPQTLTGVSVSPTDIDVIANQANPNTLTSGGVAEFDGIANPVVALQGSGTADAPYVLLRVNTTGQTAISVSYNLRDIDGSADNAIQPVALQYRVGNTGAFTNVAAGFVADASTGPSIATLVTPINVNLSTASAGAVDNQPEVQIRIITANAAGLDEWIGVDDLSVSGFGVGTSSLSIGDLSIAEGNATGAGACVTKNFAFTVTATPAPLAPIDFTFSTADGTAISVAGGAGDPDFTAVVAGAGQVAAGTGIGTATVLVNCDDAIEADQSFTVNLLAGAGYTIGDGSGLGTVVNDDAAGPATLSINAPAGGVSEGDAGTTSATFTATLSTPVAADVAFTVTTTDITATGGNATPADYQSLSLAPFTITAGTTTVDVPVGVFGDIVDENDETFSATIATIDPQVVLGTATAQASITDNDGAPVEIPAIQGTGFQGPLNNTTQVTLGNVVTGVVSDGFFMQRPTSDGLAATSDAMFVFTRTAPAVVAGNAVDVKGTVSEAAVTGLPAGAPNLSNLTKFIDTGLVVNVVGNALLPTPAILDAVVPSSNPALPFCALGGSFTPADTVLTRNFECLEGMRVTTNGGLVVAPNQSFSTDPVAELNIVVTGGGRAFREPGIRFDLSMEVPPSLTPAAPPLPPSPVWDGNPELFEMDLDRLGLPNDPLRPGTRFSATGLLGNEFGGYELFPSEITITESGRTLPIAVPVAAADQLTIASFNLLRLFNHLDEAGSHDNCATTSPGSADTCPTLQQFTNNLAKRSAYIVGVLRAPMVIGVSEVENLATLQALAAQLSVDLAGANTYVALMGTDDDNDPGHINNGFLVRNDVTVDSTAQFRTTDTFVFNGGVSGLVFDRPPFLLRATTSVGGTPLSFAVIANHLRSLSGIDDLTPLADQVDAHRVRQKRLRGAALLATEVQQFQSTNPGVPLIVTGDMNAFEFTDGYADVNGIIRGGAVPANSEYNLGFDDVATGSGPDGNIVTPPLEAALSALPAPERYSFIFGGNVQVLDHGFLSQSAVARFEGYAYGRGNADSPGVLATDFTAPNLPLRASDHDAFVIYLNAGGDPTTSGFIIFRDSLEDPPPP